MSDQALWFEPVTLLSRCSLNEGLLWVWAERVPVSNVYREKNVFESLPDWECERLGIPSVPEGLVKGIQYRTEEGLRAKTHKHMSDDGLEYYVTKSMREAEAVRQWLPLVSRQIELPATEMFLRLRRGQIEAIGKMLPESVETVDFLEDQNRYSRGNFDDLAESVIPPEFWTLAGIDWFSNSVTTDGRCYCDVSISVEVLMSIFPGARTPIDSAELVGDFVLIKEIPADERLSASRRPGRPAAFAWEAFHVEVADLIKGGGMPQKKEAAIQLMVSWFENTQKQKPSRSAVSEKLTPYYRRFFSPELN